MEPKKSEKADLTKKSGLFFNIGLVTAMLIVVSAFSYTVAEYKDLDLDDEDNNTLEEVLEAPITEQPPPPPPAKIIPIFEEVDDEEIVEQLEDLPDLDEPDPEPVNLPPPPPPAPKEDGNRIFTIVEQPAEFPDGIGAFYSFVAKKMQGKYPAQARRMGVEGKVFVKFVVEKDGSLTDIQIIKGIGFGCDELAQSVVSQSPKWKPGRQRGKPVRQSMMIPIIFKLQ